MSKNTARKKIAQHQDNYHHGEEVKKSKDFVLW
jgi:hypothetical protein